MTPDQIRAIADPIRRAKRAQEYVAKARATVDEVLAIRDAAMVEMRTRGMSQRAVAAALGLSVGRVAQVDEAAGVVVERRVTTSAPPNPTGAP